jgi:hypothetical protein
MFPQQASVKGEWGQTRANVQNGLRYSGEYNIRQDRLPSRNSDLPNAYESKPNKVLTLQYIIANAKKACYPCVIIMKVF